MPRPAPEAVRRVAIIGAGTIGASWAAYFLARGLEVVATDPGPDAEVKLRQFVERAWPTLVRLGTAAEARRESLRFVATPEEAVAGAEFVQESAPEVKETKIPLLAKLDRATPADVVISSSTSGLMMSVISRSCRRPQRFVVGHPFNPPHLIPLVEVVGGAKTAPETIDWAIAFYNAVGKRAIRINREMPGHLANRLQAAIWREAVYLVNEGVASVADIDAAIAYGPGLRWAIMGPHLTFHLGGGEGGMANFLEHFGPPIESWWDTLGSPRLTEDVRPKLIEGVAAEAGGRSVAELAAERDAALIAVLEALAKTRRRRKK
ncbi:MAG: 3-hydroxyacyl-CoA dehydrogenase [Alphaproteobacteria bacterium]|nr:3-hydroxyacyl-CoA dehydrogenase [Alphaproteobacteria bacterium]